MIEESKLRADDFDGFIRALQRPQPGQQRLIQPLHGEIRQPGLGPAVPAGFLGLLDQIHELGEQQLAQGFALGVDAFLVFGKILLDAVQLGGGLIEETGLDQKTENREAFFQIAFAAVLLHGRMRGQQRADRCGIEFLEKVIAIPVIPAGRDERIMRRQRAQMLIDNLRLPLPLRLDMDFAVPCGVPGAKVEVLPRRQTPGVDAHQRAIESEIGLAPVHILCLHILYLAIGEEDAAGAVIHQEKGVLLGHGHDDGAFDENRRFALDLALNREAVLEDHHVGLNEVPTVDHRDAER